MNVGDARRLYSGQLKQYNRKQFELAVKKNELQEKIDKTPDGKTIYEDEAVRLELSYEAVHDKYKEYKEYMDRLMQRWNSKYNHEITKQQTEAAKEEGDEMRKVMIVARRIMHGDQVPAGDERKLMEFDSHLYQMAKNIGALAKSKERKKYKSLWEEEEDKEKVDPMEAADSQELVESGPQIVSVEETLASVAGTQEE